MSNSNELATRGNMMNVKEDAQKKCYIISVPFICLSSIFQRDWNDASEKIIFPLQKKRMIRVLIF